MFPSAAAMIPRNGSKQKIVCSCLQIICEAFGPVVCRSFAPLQVSLILFFIDHKTHNLLELESRVGAMSNQKLLQARAQRHWTQEQAAARIGIGISTYRRWESGAQLPHASTLVLLCDTFKMSARDLGFPEERMFLLEKMTSPTPLETQPVEIIEQVPVKGQSRSSDADEPFTALAALLTLGESIMFDPTKRHTLEALLAAVTTILVKPQAFPQTDVLQTLLAPGTGTPKINEATIQGYAKMIEACWQLSRSSELALAEQLLPTCMTRLVPIAQQSSRYQQYAAHLAAQGFTLYGVLALHRNDLRSKELYNKQAIQYSLIATDQNLLISSFGKLAGTYNYGNQHMLALQTYQDGLRYTEEASPLLRSELYSGKALAYAHLNQRQDALTSLGTAIDMFPDNPEKDTAFSFASFDRPWLILWEGMVRSQLGQTKQALDTFNRIERPDIIAPERIRVEIINQQAKTAIFSGDLEQGAAYVDAGVRGARALGSQRRLNEAYDNYQQLCLLWPQESQVQTLADLFRH